MPDLSHLALQELDIGAKKKNNPSVAVQQQVFVSVAAMPNLNEGNQIQVFDPSGKAHTLYVPNRSTWQGTNIAFWFEQKTPNGPWMQIADPGTKKAKGGKKGALKRMGRTLKHGVSGFLDEAAKALVM